MELIDDYAIVIAAAQTLASEKDSARTIADPTNAAMALYTAGLLIAPTTLLAENPKGPWTFHGSSGNEKLSVDYPTRTGAWNCRFFISQDGESKTILQTIEAANLQAWIDQGVITR